MQLHGEKNAASSQRSTTLSSPLALVPDAFHAIHLFPILLANAPTSLSSEISPGPTPFRLSLPPSPFSDDAAVSLPLLR
jgi:hypothetical protein